MGILKQGFYGPRKLFQLADGRSIYLDLEVAQRLEQTASIGQEFWLCKRKPAGKGQKTRWDIYLEDPNPQAGETELERDLRLSLHQAEQRNGNHSQLELEAPPPKPPELTPQAPPSRPAPSTNIVQTEVAKKGPNWAVTLVNQTNELIDAYAECIGHANKYGVSVKPEDVRTLLVTTFINLCQRNGRKGVA
jgi:hypothetical protein